MSDRPHVACVLTASLDGGLHASRYTDSPDGTAKDWGAQFEALHDRLGGDAWLVGRATMAEMAKGMSHPPTGFAPPPRPLFRAEGAQAPFGVALDTHGHLHFRGGDIGGDRVVVMLGSGVGDAHLAELVADGVSYLVMDTERPDPAAVVAALAREFGVARLLVEGGAGIAGSFLAAGVVDQLHVLVAPALDGRVGHDAIVAAGEDGLKGGVRLSLAGCEPIGHGTVHLRYDVLGSRAP